MEKILPLGQQLENLLQDYKSHMQDSHQGQLLAIMKQMKQFLMQYEPLIMEQCALNGYSNQSPDWTQHYAGFFSGTLEAINFDEHLDKKHFDPNLIFENLTQLHYLMTVKLNS